jgi:hypothetical protein
MNNPSPLPLSELEVRLTSAQGTTIKKEYLARLRHLENRLNVYLKAGPSPTNYEKNQALAYAIRTAILIMEQYPITDFPAAPSILTSTGTT